MSGGSFNHAYHKAKDTAEIFQAMAEYRDIEAYLRWEGRDAAADEVLKFVQACEAAQQQLAVMGARIAPILRAAERTCSFDCGIESVDEAYAALDATTKQAGGE